MKKKKSIWMTAFAVLMSLQMFAQSRYLFYGRVEWGGNTQGNRIYPFFIYGNRMFWADQMPPGSSGEINGFGPGHIYDVVSSSDLVNGEEIPNPFTELHGFERDPIPKQKEINGNTFEVRSTIRYNYKECDFKAGAYFHVGTHRYDLGYVYNGYMYRCFDFFNVRNRLFKTSDDYLGETNSYAGASYKYCKMFMSVCPDHKASVKQLGETTYSESSTVSLNAIGADDYEDYDIEWEYSLDGTNYQPLEDYGHSITVGFWSFPNAQYGRNIYVRLKYCDAMYYNNPSEAPEGSNAVAFRFYPELPKFKNNINETKERCPGEAPQPVKLLFDKNLSNRMKIDRVYLFSTVYPNGKPADAQDLDFTVSSDGITVNFNEYLIRDYYYLTMEGSADGTPAVAMSTQIKIEHPNVLTFETAVTPASGTEYHQGVPKILNDGIIEFTMGTYIRNSALYLDNHTPHYATTRFDELVPKRYLAKITYNFNQCDTSFYVDVPLSKKSLNISIDDVSPALCYGDSSAFISANVRTENVGNVRYTWYKDDVPMTDQSGEFSANETLLGMDNLPKGNYKLECKAGKLRSTYAVDVTEPEPIKATVKTLAHPLCYGSSDGFIHVQISGGTAPYRYFWNDIEGTDFTENRSAGEYTLMITDNHNCSFTQTFTLLDPPQMTLVSEDLKHPTCYQKSDGEIQIHIEGGTGKYTWMWNENPGTSRIKGLSEGTNAYFVADENHCSLSGEVTLIAPKALKIDTIERIEQSYFGAELGEIQPSANDGLLRVSARYGTPPYTYKWSNACTDSVLTQLTYGTFHVTVSDAHGCKQKATFKLPERKPLRSTLKQTAQVLCFDEKNAALSASVSGGVSPYSYAWKHTSSKTLSQKKLGTGVYEFEVTDSRGVRSFDRIFISQPEPLNVLLSADSVSGWEVSDGSISALASGGTPPYMYDWGFSNTAHNKDLPAGVYRLQLSDTNGCKRVDSITIETPDSLRIIGNVRHCSYFGAVQGFVQNGFNDGSIDCQISGGVKPYDCRWFYQFPNGEWAELLSKNPYMDSLTSGRYLLKVTDNKGFRASDTFEITKQEPLIATLKATPPRCFETFDGTLQTFVNGGIPPYTYRWNMGDTTAFVQGLSAGHYNVVVRDSLGIQSSFEIALQRPSPLTADFSVQGISGHGLCNGAISATTQGGTAPYTYLWTGRDTLYHEAHISNLHAGFYRLQVSDSNGCEWSSSIALNEPNALVVESYIKPLSYVGTIQGRAAPIPADGEIYLIVSGGFPPYRYVWQTGEQTAYLTGLSAGSYAVRVLDENNNETYATFHVNATEPLLLTLRQDSAIACFGEASARLKAHVSGGIPPYSYRWNTGDTSEILESLNAGEYELSVCDSLGITAIFTMKIEEPQPLSITESVIQPQCPNPLNGAINLSVSGGTPPYRYQWNTQHRTAQLQYLSSGNYSATVTDVNACQKNQTFALQTPMKLTVEQQDFIRCFGDSNVSLSVSVCGGIPPYTIRWNTGDTTWILQNRKGGEYRAVVEDAEGNTDTVTHWISEPDSLSIAGTPTNPLCFDAQNGRIEVEVNGGTPPYLYQWSNTAQTPQLTNIGSGDYHLFVTDRNGCPVIYSASLVNPEKIEVELGEDRRLCAGQYLRISLPDEDLSYQWKKDTVFLGLGSTLECSETAVYTVIAENKNGCQVFDTLRIETLSERIDAEFWLSNDAFVGVDFVVANIGKTPTDSVIWTVTPNAEIRSQSKDYFQLHFLDTGNYEIRLKTYKNGCFEECSAMVYVANSDENILKSVARKSSLFDLKIFPNPAEEDFNFSVQAPKNTSIQWTLTHVSTGITVQSGQSQSNANGFVNQHILLQKSTPGVYVLRVFNGNEQTGASLIIH